MKRLILPLLFLIGLILSGCASDSHPVDNKINVNELELFIQAEIDEYGVPGVQVCILDEARNETNISLGYSSTEPETEMDDFIQIMAGSITKSFTGIGILKLVQKGLVNLDDSLGQYVTLDDHSHDGITVGALLNMHSGLRGYLNDDGEEKISEDMIADYDRHFSPEELVAYGFQLTDVMGTTGENEFHYTNTNYILLGMIIESVTGQGYTEYIRQEITEPFGLYDTYIPVDNEYPENISGGYLIDMESGEVYDYSGMDLSYVWSAGAVITTASDLCKWMNLIGNDEVVSKEVLNYVYEGVEIAESTEMYYTSGLTNEPTKIWHNGTILGYHGEMCYHKDSGYSIAVLSNCNVVGVESDPVKNIMNEIISMVEQ